MPNNETRNSVPGNQLEDDLHGIIDNQLQHYFTLYLLGLGCVLISVFGVITNVINIIVFVRQGFKESTSMSLLSLSISDLVSNVCTLCFGMCSIADEMKWLIHIDWLSLGYIGFAWQRVMFLDVSMFTTVFISVERCLCVVMPFKVKGLFTPSRVIKIQIVIYTFILACYAPIFATGGLSWQEDLITNSTRLTVWLGSYREPIETYSNIFNNIFIPTVSHVTVLVCTCLTIIGLKASSTARKKLTSAQRKPSSYLYHQRDEMDANNEPKSIQTHDRITSPSNIGPRNKDLRKYKLQNNVKPNPKILSSNLTSAKDKSAAKVVITVAFVFIMCALPQVVLVYGRRFVLELDLGKRYENLHNTLFGLAYFMGGINASVNMFIYLNASSRYRATFQQTFCNIIHRGRALTI